MDCRGRIAMLWWRHIAMAVIDFILSLASMHLGLRWLQIEMRFYGFVFVWCVFGSLVSSIAVDFQSVMSRCCLFSCPAHVLCSQGMPACVGSWNAETKEREVKQAWSGPCDPQEMWAGRKGSHGCWSVAMLRMNLRNWIWGNRERGKALQTGYWFFWQQCLLVSSV